MLAAGRMTSPRVVPGNRAYRLDNLVICAFYAEESRGRFTPVDAEVSAHRDGSVELVLIRSGLIDFDYREPLGRDSLNVVIELH